MTPFRAPKDYPNWAEVADLIHASFAYMTPLLGHAAHAISVTTDDLEHAAQTGAVLLVEDQRRPVACLFTRISRDVPNALYVGWLAVAADQRGKGMAQTLMHAAEAEASAQGKTALTLDTGRILTDLHRVFRSMGFQDIPATGEIITFHKLLK